MYFDDFWRHLKDELQEEQTIRNWTMDKEYLGGDFDAIAKGNYIECYPPKAKNLQKVPRSDFQFMYENWQNYIHRRIRRRQLSDRSRFTKYTISIIRQFEHLI
jgi:hypothetical protein